MFMYDIETGKLIDDDKAQIEFCMETAGVTESHAQFILAMEKGEITGDRIIETEEDDAE